MSLLFLWCTYCLGESVINKIKQIRSTTELPVIDAVAFIWDAAINTSRQIIVSSIHNSFPNSEKPIHILVTHTLFILVEVRWYFIGSSSFCSENLCMVFFMIKLIKSLWVWKRNVHGNGAVISIQLRWTPLLTDKEMGKKTTEIRWVSYRAQLVKSQFVQYTSELELVLSRKTVYYKSTSMYNVKMMQFFKVPIAALCISFHPVPHVFICSD